MCMYKVVTGISHWNRVEGLQNAYRVADEEKAGFPGQEVVIYGVVTRKNSNEEVLLKMEDE